MSEQKAGRSRRNLLVGMLLLIAIVIAGAVFLVLPQLECAYDFPGYESRCVCERWSATDETHCEVFSRR